MHQSIVLVSAGPASPVAPAVCSLVPGSETVHAQVVSSDVVHPLLHCHGAKPRT